MNFTHNNHIKYTIEDRLYGYRNNSYEKFSVTVGQIDKDYYRSSNFQKELKRIANLIYCDYGKNFALFLSGGTDSEIVLRNFLDIGIKPTCYTIKFLDDYNILDVNEAIKLCNDLGVKIELINFDVKNFLYSGEAVEFGKQIQCTQITYLIVYHSILKVGLPSIMGGELLLKRNIDTNPSSWYYCLRENEDCSAMRFSLKYGLPLVNEYFSYTPEIMLYYLENLDIQSLVSNRYNCKLTSVSSKNSILKKLIPEIRVRKKTHGFEKLLSFNFESNVEILSEQILRTEPWLDGIEYHHCINMLKGKNVSC